MVDIKPYHYSANLVPPVKLDGNDNFYHHRAHNCLVFTIIHTEIIL